MKDGYLISGIRYWWSAGNDVTHSETFIYKDHIELNRQDDGRDSYDWDNSRRGLVDDKEVIQIGSDINVVGKGYETWSFFGSWQLRI